MKNAVALAVVILAAVVVGLRMKHPSGSLMGPATPTHAWPPEKGKPYPDLELEDPSGKVVKLSSLRGKVVLVEPIGVACPACNAYSGGDDKGGFRGSFVQEKVGSFDRLLRQYAGVRLDSEPDLVLVQLLLFDMSSSVGHPATKAEQREWVDHFGLAGRENVLVLRGTEALANGAGYAMVPGFQLVDRKGILRYDGSGHEPKDHPYEVALGQVPTLLRESP